MKRIAIDTNILFRLMINDGSAQSDLAVELARRFKLFVSKTVLLETEWVLRSVARLQREEINDRFLALLKTQGMDVEAENEVFHALRAHHAGMDLSDAFHVVGAEAYAGTFATFDKTLIKLAPAQFDNPEVVSCSAFLDIERQQERPSA